MTVIDSKERLNALPEETLLPQSEVQERLHGLASQGYLTGEILTVLEEWLRSVGYFSHLKEPNLFLRFPGWWTDSVELWLQVNYSRLGYRAPSARQPQHCPLCIENIGSEGKELLRVYEFELASTWYFAHPTPYPLHDGHFVLNVREHAPMRVNRQSLDEAYAFLQQAPGWLLASNSDVEWAGASVLGHHHFQVFRGLQLPVEHAPWLASRRDGATRVQWVNWPAPVARLVGPPEDVLLWASDLIETWKAIDPGRNTGNYLMRLVSGVLTLTFFFRNPAYVTADELKVIKSEGVGIVEMAGEAIVPPKPNLDRNGNREYFEKIGAEFTVALITSNAPPAYCEKWEIPSLLGFHDLPTSKRR